MLYRVGVFYSQRPVNFALRLFSRTALNFLGKYTRLQRSSKSIMEQVGITEKVLEKNGDDDIEYNTISNNYPDSLPRQPFLQHFCTSDAPPEVPLEILTRFSKKIRLSPIEQKIIQLLLDCCQSLKLSVTLRIAGGWVRDKVPIPSPIYCIIQAAQ
jgi:hypothetical protein